MVQGLGFRVWGGLGFGLWRRSGLGDFCRGLEFLGLGSGVFEVNPGVSRSWITFGAHLQSFRCPWGSKP